VWQELNEGATRRAVQPVRRAGGDPVSDDGDHVAVIGEEIHCKHSNTGHRDGTTAIGANAAFAGVGVAVGERAVMVVMSGRAMVRVRRRSRIMAVVRMSVQRGKPGCVRGPAVAADAWDHRRHRKRLQRQSREEKQDNKLAQALDHRKKYSMRFANGINPLSHGIQGDHVQGMFYEGLRTRPLRCDAGSGA
jgi:hypothetical protein